VWNIIPRFFFSRFLGCNFEPVSSAAVHSFHRYGHKWLGRNRLCILFYMHVCKIRLLSRVFWITTITKNMWMEELPGFFSSFSGMWEPLIRQLVTTI
jgi:hypothetical protein